ncbi:hypothetical protein ACETK8_04470 [Brevundimonas staleyi]|uniref:Uncharacterized protein n=1 Tax=Brevundimonas staleyi TaxID=74326 RepID=A0ABW0FY10_9CAUL
MSKTTSAQDWRSPGAMTLALLVTTVLSFGLTDPLPLWPATWAYSPSIGTTLLAVTIVAAVASFGRRHAG